MGGKQLQQGTVAFGLVNQRINQGQCQVAPLTRELAQDFVGILEGYVEEDLDAAALVARGFDRDTVNRVIRLVNLSEYKRRQAPPGVKITPKAFGRDRRMPLTNAFRETV